MAVTANCDNVEPWAAVPIGLVAATMYSYGVKFIHKILNLFIWVIILQHLSQA